MMPDDADEKDETTGVVQIHTDRAAQSARECEEKANSVRKKFKALREKLAQGQYKHVVGDRRSQPT